MNVVLWIRDPYPFWAQEQRAIEQALRLTYGNQSLVYLYRWDVHRVSIDDTNITTCRKIADTLKTIHRMHARLAQNLEKTYCTHLEIDIRGFGDAPPEWAKEQG
jgi:hypothetical protein